MTIIDPIEDAESESSSPRRISTGFEIGHFESCTALGQPATLSVAPGVTDVYYNQCPGPYERTAPGADNPNSPEVGDAFCFPAGDTHGVLNTAPDLLTGCMDNFYQNGDLDFDGTAYWPEWPTGATPTRLLPASFVQSPPLTRGEPYPWFSFQTDVALSEVATCTPSTLSGCAVPPPNAPGRFYPYWSTVTGSAGCGIEFGNVSDGPGVNAFGGDAQYGTNQLAQIGYAEFESGLHPNTCQGSQPRRS